jgi:hypothetical protein
MKRRIVVSIRYNRLTWTEILGLVGCILLRYNEMGDFCCTIHATHISCGDGTTKITHFIDRNVIHVITFIVCLHYQMGHAATYKPEGRGLETR